MKVRDLRGVAVRRWGVVPTVSKKCHVLLHNEVHNRKPYLLDPVQEKKPVPSKRRVPLNQQHSVTSQKTRTLTCNLRKNSGVCIKLRFTYKQAKSISDTQLLHNDCDVICGHTSAVK